MGQLTNTQDLVEGLNEQIFKELGPRANVDLASDKKNWWTYFGGHCCRIECELIPPCFKTTLDHLGSCWYLSGIKYLSLPSPSLCGPEYYLAEALSVSRNQ